MNIEDTKMCIYQIIHWESGNSYVGQTTKRVGTRWHHHCHPTRGNKKLANAINKYGRDAFEFAVIEECKTPNELNEREIHWIKELNTLSPNGYNLDSGGKNKIPSEETRKKSADATRAHYASLTDEQKLLKADVRRQNILNKINSMTADELIAYKLMMSEKSKLASPESQAIGAMKRTGQKRTEETKKKQSNSLRGHVVSESTKQKMRKPKSEIGRINMSVMHLMKNIDNVKSSPIAPEIAKSRLRQINRRSKNQNFICDKTQILLRETYKNLLLDIING